MLIGFHIPLSAAFERYKNVGTNVLWTLYFKVIVPLISVSQLSKMFAFSSYYMQQVLQLILGVESQWEFITGDLCIRLVGGGLAGITAASVTYPLDLVRTRLAAQVSGILMVFWFNLWKFDLDPITILVLEPSFDFPINVLSTMPWKIIIKKCYF